MECIPRRGDRVTINTGKYASRTGTVKSNVYRRTIDRLSEFVDGYQLMLGSGELVTARRYQVVCHG
ncbi:MAG: hypothetical protein H8E48_13125 [Chloroflexi bacterium]|nr:hypothetical protein [Chloroflexota bacterium]